MSSSRSKFASVPWLIDVFFFSLHFAFCLHCDLPSQPNNFYEILICYFVVHITFMASMFIISINFVIMNWRLLMFSAFIFVVELFHVFACSHWLPSGFGGNFLSHLESPPFSQYPHRRQPHRVWTVSILSRISS